MVEFEKKPELESLQMTEALNVSPRVGNKSSVI